MPSAPRARVGDGRGSGRGARGCARTSASPVGGARDRSRGAYSHRSAVRGPARGCCRRGDRGDPHPRRERREERHRGRRRPPPRPPPPALRPPTEEACLPPPASRSRRGSTGRCARDGRRADGEPADPSVPNRGEAATRETGGCAARRDRDSAARAGPSSRPAGSGGAPPRRRSTRCVPPRPARQAAGGRARGEASRDHRR